MLIYYFFLEFDIKVNFYQKKNYWFDKDLTKYIYWLVIVLIVFIISSLELIKWINKKSIKSRRCFYILFIYLCISSLIVIITRDYQHLLFLFTPLSIIISNYFIFANNRLLASFLFMLLILNSFYNRFIII